MVFGNLNERVSKTLTIFQVRTDKHYFFNSIVVVFFFGRFDDFRIICYGALFGCLEIYLLCFSPLRYTCINIRRKQLYDL